MMYVPFLICYNLITDKKSNRLEYSSVIIATEVCHHPYFRK